VTNISDNDKAAETLSRVIEKDDFGKMDVVGQFNKGFIIVRLWKALPPAIAEEQHKLEGLFTDDLFIVDQHAADEKYNFDTLQLTTKMESQKLFQSVCFSPSTRVLISRV